MKAFSWWKEAMLFWVKEKISKKRMEVMVSKEFGGSERELNIFFLCFEKGASFFLIRKTNLNRKEVG